MQEHFLLFLSSVLFLFDFCHWACVILMKMLASNYQHVPFKKQIKIILATGIKPVNLIVPPCPGICAQLSEKPLITQASLNFVLYERIVWEGHRKCFYMVRSCTSLWFWKVWPEVSPAMPVSSWCWLTFAWMWGRIHPHVGFRSHPSQRLFELLYSPDHLLAALLVSGS